MTYVVIVEDTPWMAEQFARSLARESVKTAVVNTAQKAIDTVDEHIPDVIVLDMLLPEVTALALLHELQSHSDLAAIPVILVSTIADQLSAKDLRPYGVVEVLDKTTMAPDDIVRAIRRLV